MGGLWQNNFLMKYYSHKFYIDPNGSFRAFHKNGKLAEIGLMINDSRQGLWKEYHESGLLKRICEYKDGIRNGRYELYEDGVSLSNVYKIGHYDYGTPRGLWRTFFSNEQMASIEYLNMGPQPWQKFYKSGQLKERVYRTFEVFGEIKEDDWPYTEEWIPDPHWTESRWYHICFNEDGSISHHGEWWDSHDY